LREFVAFDGSKYITSRLVNKVPNQDLHSITTADLVIVAPPLFYDQAVRLATYHANTDDLNAIVLAPELIYNEYSSGSLM